MKNKYIFCVVFFLWICSGFYVSAQSASSQGETARQDSNTGISEINQNIMLARSSADYRVTPGDVYTLAYAIGSTPISYIITVDASYRIRVSNLGIVNGSGKTFMQLKNDVETVVANNYPLSGVQLVLTQPAVFRVYINGEVQEAKEIPAWGLSRLSTLLENNFTGYTSIRDISIKSLNGQTRMYDLFKAQRLGDLSQDPYLRPGDVITFNRIKRVITIVGAVERPGTYQLLDGENIKELIAFYGSGFTPVADKTRLEMVRLINGTDVAGDKIFLTENDLADNYALEHYDVIIVPEITRLMPVMFVEGAVARTWQSLDDAGNSTTSAASDLISSNRLVVQFNQGETYASLVRKNINWFTSVSDTQNAYIIRNDEHIPINLNPMLYDASYRGEVFVQENDVLIIPFRQYFVTVAGAVISPGRYPYIPDRDWEYYVALAGGFIMERNRRETVKITDINGKQLKKTDAISPETTITASTNHTLYYFNLYAPVITTVMSVITAALSIWAITSR
jgi:protein involved in polysaccharide export with SLBB domain